MRLRGAPVAMPTFGTAQFQRFFDCGRAIRCLLLWVVVGHEPGGFVWI